MSRRLAALLAVATLLAPVPAFCDTAAAVPVRIGVLAFKGGTEAASEWDHLTGWLDARVPGHRFALVDFDQNELTKAVHERTVDFVLTNSGHYVMLERSEGASRIVTVESPWALSPTQSIGSAIVVRGGAAIRSLPDLAGKRVLAVGREAFGGYLVAVRELVDAGVDPERDFAALRFTGFPMQAILRAVQAGEADAGIVRVCMLEEMVRRGEIAPGALRVLAPRDIPGFGCGSSSRLYPDWPIAALRHTPPALSRQVAVALLSMPPTPDGYSWTVASDYQSVDALFQQLRLGHYAWMQEWTLEGLARRHWGWLLLAAGVLVAWAAHTVRVEHLINQRTRALQLAGEERRRMEDEARGRQATLDHVSRLAILGEMASAIAHELNQPLAAIRNFADGISRRIAAGRVEPEPLQSGAREIAAQSDRAAGIIRNIRAFARKRGSEHRTVDLVPVLQEAISMFAGAHSQARVAWQAPHEGAAALVWADPLQIQQVMLNLLKNALDAHHAAGRLHDPIEVGFAETPQGYCVEVRDSGSGVQPELFARLFEPFFTTKADGFGLGLSISKGIIESSGGMLSARANAQGEGLTVWFTLPRREPAALADAMAATGERNA